MARKKCTHCIALKYKFDIKTQEESELFKTHPINHFLYIFTFPNEFTGSKSRVWGGPYIDLDKNINLKKQKFV